MKRRIVLGITVTVAMTLLSLVAWQCSCETPYDVTVDFKRTSDPTLHHTVTGDIRACGVLRFAGSSGFGFALPPGARPSASRGTGTLGSDIVTVEAAIASDGRTGWYTATLERGGHVVPLHHETVRLTR